MPYIGKQPLTGAYQLCDAIVTSATATYNLLVGGSAVIPGSANNCIVSLNGVVQAPVSAFTVSGSTITFASTLSATDVIDFILILGNVFDIGTPTNGAVTNSSLNSNVITGQTAETSIAGGDLVLLYDDSASALRKMTRTNFISGLATTNGITMVDRWRLTTDFTNTAQPIASNLERADETDAGFIGTGMSESSGIFTFPSTGIYLIQAQFAFQLNGDVRDIAHAISRTTNNSTYAVVSSNDIFIRQTSSLTTWNGNFISYTFDVTNVSTHKVRFDVEVTANTATTTRGTTTSDLTAFTFIRLGDT